MDVSTDGFASPQASSLGLMGASPLELAGVYASFRHDGKKVTPSIVKSAERDGERTQLRSAIGEPGDRPPGPPSLSPRT